QRIARPERQLGRLPGRRLHVHALRATLACRERQGEGAQPLEERLTERRQTPPVLRTRLLYFDARHRVGGARDAGLVAAEAEPRVELAAARGGIEVAGRVVVDADLLLRRQPVAVERGGLHVDRRLEQAVGALRAPARNA